LTTYYTEAHLLRYNYNNWHLLT